MKTSDFYFNVNFVDEIGCGPYIAMVGVEFFQREGNLDDSLGSHSLTPEIQQSLMKAGVYGLAEEMEAIWSIHDETKTKEDIITSMKDEGFIYKPDLLD